MTPSKTLSFVKVHSGKTIGQTSINALPTCDENLNLTALAARLGALHPLLKVLA